MGRPPEPSPEPPEASAGQRLTVLGAGSWGTALAHHLRRAGHEVSLWGRDPEILRAISATGRHPRCFPDLTLAPGLKTCPNLEEALEGCQGLVVAVPSGAVRGVARLAARALSPGCLVVSSSKGLESTTLLRMSEVLASELGRLERITVLSGPTFARELVGGLTTAAVCAGSLPAMARRAASLFHHDQFRLYTSTDLVGVELGGVLKNVVALAVGISDGAGMGDNARAALITRGLSEMKRLVVALGGQGDTLTGLSGLGDLLLTATGDQSRNRQVGLRLGQGEPLQEILKSLREVAEGVSTATAAVELARAHELELPLFEEIRALVQGESTVRRSIQRLLARAPKLER